ncbi:hypothetical protein PSCICO_47990 [Pseudomonas cichorii]|uniref:hypothetical protein n=1 Tax=Pseudomonas cichorii TaxID=36746 RepID=UPI0019101C39|nr:hypothetical protein [Pseudomonas cichorii]GFM89400.1 hypothetical protein PSCICO_47990 [Pseudomonas cichorii]
MTKHTPGPWAVDESRHEGAINRKDPFRHIGMVSQFLHDASSRAENEANAKLIAAAPDLLSIAERVLAKLDHPVCCVTSSDAEELRAAIAKATA